MYCNVCSNATTFIDKAQVLNKYDIQYFHCTFCGFVQTEKPYWLDEAYSEAINQSDLGLLSRNIALARITKVIIMTLFNSNTRFMDYGGGYGVFVRLMRDFGFDFYRFDKFCTNLFSVGFDADMKETYQYELLTAFEVFEHLTSPLDEIESMLNFSKNILFSTLLLPSNNPKPNEWWYYGLDHGQHISFFTLQSLRVIADKFSLNLYSNGSSLHLLTEKKISSSWFSLISRDKVSQILNLLLKKESLLNSDYFQITGKSPN
jgi:Methyltransferase domain